ncbi:MAG: c-type cytochrome [Lewinellaceae bacterium]|nr:c-type cytochrome [Lewinellaceae bacterium]
MKKVIFLPSAFAVCMVLALSFCKKVEITDPSPDNQAIVQKYLALDVSNVPNYAAPVFPVPYGPNIQATDNAPSINRVTDAGAALGRVLFYDKNLSRNNTIACNSCHLQEKGFSDDRTFSRGIEGELTGAHSMRLANANFYTGERMFWNKRAVDLEDQVTQPIKDPIEMGFDAAHGGMDALLQKMQGLEYYPALFEETFGSREITEEKMKRALAQFVRSMVSTGSKFDQGFTAVFNPGAPGAGNGAPFPNYTQQENRGKQLFILGPPQGVACAACHTLPTFALAQNSLSNGLDAGETIIFKSPSLKNLAATGPYMHDGRFQTLEEVIEHYNSGVQNGPALDNRLRIPPGQPNAGQPLRLNLSADDKAALAAFLRTLTDDALLVDEKFATPFR